MSAAPRKKVPVWSPSGDREEHTLPNARDLVNGAGYSWTPHRKSSPVAVSPHFVPPAKAKNFPKELGKEVLDGEVPASSEEASAEEGDSEATETFEPEPTVDEFPAETVTEVQEPAPPTRRRAPRNQRINPFDEE